VGSSEEKKQRKKITRRKTSPASVAKPQFLGEVLEKEEMLSQGPRGGQRVMPRFQEAGPQQAQPKGGWEGGRTRERPPPQKLGPREGASARERDHKQKAANETNFKKFSNSQQGRKQEPVLSRTGAAEHGTLLKVPMEAPGTFLGKEIEFGQKLTKVGVQESSLLGGSSHERV